MALSGTGCYRDAGTRSWVIASGIHFMDVMQSTFCRLASNEPLNAAALSLESPTEWELQNIASSRQRISLEWTRVQSLMEGEQSIVPMLLLIVLHSLHNALLPSEWPVT